MELKISHKNISVINAHTFDIITKGKDTDSLIQQFYQLEEIQIPRNTTIHVGIFDYSIKLRQWKIKDVKQTIDFIEKNNTNLVYRQLFDDLKKFVTGMKITVWEPEYLPFNYVILSVDFSGKILDSRDSYGWLRMSLLPIINYWRPSGGLIPYRGEMYFPMFFQLYYESKSIKPELTKVFNELEKLLAKKLDIKKYVKSCNSLKNYFLLEHLDKYHNLISLLKIQDDFFLLGNMGQLDSDIFNVFSLEPDSYKYSGTNPFLLDPFTSWPFSRLFLLYVISVTPLVWNEFNKTKLTKILKEVNDLKNAYRNNDNLPSNTEDSLERLLSSKHELNYLFSDLDEIKKLVKIFKSHILDNPEINEKSIVVAPENAKLKTDLIKNKIQATYLHELNKGFDLGSKDTTEYVTEIQKDLAFLEVRINPLQQRLIRKSNSKLSKTMLYLAIIATIFTIIVGTEIIGKWINSLN